MSKLTGNLFLNMHSCVHIKIHVVSISTSQMEGIHKKPEDIIHVTTATDTFH